MAKEPSTRQLLEEYLEFLCNGNERSQDLGWIPPCVSSRGDEVTYFIGGAYISLSFPTLDTYERDIKREIYTDENPQRNKIPLNQSGRPDFLELIKQNQASLKAYLEKHKNDQSPNRK
jgi:hypothetical protein